MPLIGPQRWATSRPACRPQGHAILQVRAGPRLPEVPTRTLALGLQTLAWHHPAGAHGSRPPGSAATASAVFSLLTGRGKNRIRSIDPCRQRLRR